MDQDEGHPASIKLVATVHEEPTGKSFGNFVTTPKNKLALRETVLDREADTSH